MSEDKILNSLEEIMKNNGIKGEAIHQCMI